MILFSPSRLCCQSEIYKDASTGKKSIVLSLLHHLLNAWEQLLSRELE